MLNIYEAKDYLEAQFVKLLYAWKRKYAPCPFCKRIQLIDTLYCEVCRRPLDLNETMSIALPELQKIQYDYRLKNAQDTINQIKTEYDCKYPKYIVRKNVDIENTYCVVRGPSKETLLEEKWTAISYFIYFGAYLAFLMISFNSNLIGKYGTIYYSTHSRRRVIFIVTLIFLLLYCGKWLMGIANRYKLKDDGSLIVDSAVFHHPHIIFCKTHMEMHTIHRVIIIKDESTGDEHIRIEIWYGEVPNLKKAYLKESKETYQFVAILENLSERFGFPYLIQKQKGYKFNWEW